MPDPTGDMPPDVAAELRLLRAEIAAISAAYPPRPPPPWARRARLIPGRRPPPAAASPAVISRQRRRSLVLLATGAARIAAWTILAALIAAGFLHAAGFGWARHLAGSLPFVVMISIYANWATEVGSVTAAFAALIASDAHRDVAATRTAVAADFAALEADVARLAALQPGPEATRLAASIRRRLAGEQPPGSGERLFDPGRDAPP